MNKLFIALLIANAYLLDIKTSVAKPSVLGFQHAGEPLKSQQLIPHLVSNENYVEKYTFNANLTDSNGVNGRLYFSISINNIGAGDHKLHAKGTLELGEERFTWNSKKSSDQWKSQNQKLDIKAGGVSLSGDLNQLLFKVKGRKESFELRFTPTVSPWRPYQGGVKFGQSKSKAEFALFPMGEFNGKWQTKTGQIRSMSGSGWGRHSWSHLGPHEWSRWSQLIRIFDVEKKQTAFIRRVQVGADYKPQVISYVVVTSGNQIIFDGYGVEIQAEQTFTDKNHKNKYTFPTQFTVKAKDQSKQSVLELKVDTNKKLYHRNPIAKLSWVKRKLVEMVTKPMEYAYTVNYNLQIRGSHPINMNGNLGRYEIFHLN